MLLLLLLLSSHGRVQHEAGRLESSSIAVSGPRLEPVALAPSPFPAGNEPACSGGYCRSITGAKTTVPLVGLNGWTRGDALAAGGVVFFPSHLPDGLMTRARVTFRVTPREAGRTFTLSRHYATRLIFFGTDEKSGEWCRRQRRVEEGGVEGWKDREAVPMVLVLLVSQDLNGAPVPSACTRASVWSGPSPGEGWDQLSAGGRSGHVLLLRPESPLGLCAAERLLLPPRNAHVASLQSAHCSQMHSCVRAARREALIGRASHKAASKSSPKAVLSHDG